MKHNFLLITASLVIIALACSCNGGDNPKPKPVKGYTNPVSMNALPDPSITKGDDGYYYLYASEGAIKGLTIMRSKNLVNWENVGTVFSPARRPSFDGNSGGMLWAPEIARIGSKYVLYYSYYTPAGEMQWGIGAAIADKPEGPWTNKGKLFTGNEIGVRCSIDPSFFSDSGKNYLIWGSYYGIWAIELTEDGLRVKEDAEKVRLAGTDGYGLEASMIYKKDGKYYLFVSEGGTGYDEHYKVGAARADSFLGPYKNKAGNSVIGAAVDFFVSAGNGFVSPGHSSEIITDGNGQDWILYHAFIQGEPDNGRRLMLDRLDWKDGWPTLGDGHPTKESSVVPADGGRVNK